MSIELIAVETRVVDAEVLDEVQFVAGVLSSLL